VLQANDRLLARGTQWAQAQRGRIELLAIPSMAHRLLPMLVRDFTRTCPEVRVNVHDHPDPVLRQRLERGEGDLAIMTPAHDGAGRAMLPFLRDHFRVLLVAGHPLARKPQIDVRDLAAEPLILLRRGALLRSYMDVAIGSLQLQHPPLEVDQIGTLVGMVEAGLGVALLPAMGCPTPALRSVVNRPLHQTSVHRLIAFALPSAREPMPAVQAFIRDALKSLTAHRDRLPEGCDLLAISASDLRDFFEARPSTHATPRA
jgi:DNA-binding transcriptional LysR family regulator